MPREGVLCVVHVKEAILLRSLGQKACSASEANESECATVAKARKFEDEIRRQFVGRAFKFDEQ